MALALNILVVQKQLERCSHFPPGIQDWVTDLGNVGKVKESHWVFFPPFKIGVCNHHHHHTSSCALYHLLLHVLNLEGQNSVAPKYYTMTAGVSSSLLYVGGMGHVDLWWEVFHGRGSGTGWFLKSFTVQTILRFCACRVMFARPGVTVHIHAQVLAHPEVQTCWCKWHLAG